MPTTPQAARALGVTARRVRQLIAKGKLRAEKVGRDWIVKEQDLAEFAKIPRKPGRPKEGRLHEGA